MKKRRILVCSVLALSIFLLLVGTPVFAATRLRESEDLVDNNTSNVGAPIDIGAHGNFSAQQYYDAYYDTLTEEDTLVGGGSEWLDCDGNDSTYQTWTRVGAEPYLDAQDEPTNYIYSRSQDSQGHFTFTDTSLTGSGISVNFSIYGWNDDGPNDDDIEVFWGHNGSYYSAGELDLTLTKQYYTVTISGETFSQIQVNNMQIYLTHLRVGGNDDVYADHARMGTSQAGGSNYELDLEVQWTAADYDESTEWLCINTGAQDAENLQVDVWDGSWVTLIADLNDSSWNNVSIGNYLTSSTFTIRFVDTDKASD
ncbi:MAG: hypothetical protein ACFE7A_06380, partial [Promethearchaeota archaeon]